MSEVASVGVSACKFVSFEDYGVDGFRETMRWQFPKYSPKHYYKFTEPPNKGVIDALAEGENKSLEERVNGVKIWKPGGGAVLVFDDSKGSRIVLSADEKVNIISKHETVSREIRLAHPQVIVRGFNNSGGSMDYHLLSNVHDMDEYERIVEVIVYNANAILEEKGLGSLPMFEFGDRE